MVAPSLAFDRTYDAWNRLVAVQVSQGEVYRYEYDGLNRRTVRHYDYDQYGEYCWYSYHHASWQVLEERYGEGQSAQPETLQPYWQYVWSARYIDAPVERDENNDQDGLCNNGRLYYLTDANFNVTTLLDTGGEALERYLYDPYGKVRIYSANWAATQSETYYNSFLYFTGREYDPETGFYHYRRRPYTVDLARFLSRDPIGYNAGDPNLYAYLFSDPTNDTDAFGLGPRGTTARGQAFKDLLAETSGRRPGYRPIEETLDQVNAVLDVPYHRAIGQGALDIAEGVPNAAIRVVNQAAEAAVAQPAGIPIGSLVARLLQGRRGCGDEGLVPNIPEWHWAESRWFPEDHAWHEATTTLGGESGLMLITLGIGEVVQFGRLGAAAPTKTGTALARELGQAGQDAAGIVKNTTRIDSLSGASAYRVPDGLTPTTLTEVKNVARLDFTTQIQDSLHYSMMTGREFVIYVRPNTVLSQPLLDAIDAGYMTLRYLPH